MILAQATDIETVSTLKGLSQLGTGLGIAVLVCYVLVKYILPFFERCLDKILVRHKESLDTIVASYDKFLIKISDNLEKSLTSLATDIRELRAEIRDDLRDHRDVK